MKKGLFLWFILFCSAFYGGCSYSLVENSILSDIPAEYKNYKDGIVKNPSSNEIEEAVSFGKRFKDKDNVVDYTYIFKPDLDTYIHIKSPMYLLSRHALEKAKEYRVPDSSFIEYCKKVSILRIDVKSYKDYDFYITGIKPEVILLRNGVRVEPVSQIPLINGENPFDLSAYNAQYNAILRQTKEQMKLAFSQTSLNPYEQNSLNVGDNSNYFLIDDIREPGNYEIVINIKTYDRFSKSETKELKYPITFNSFK